MSGPSDAGEIDLRLALVRQRYGDRLTAEQLEDLRRAVEAIVAHVAAIRRIRLTNADEPLPLFAPFRADE
jgi:hypothetical protein